MTYYTMLLEFTKISSTVRSITNLLIHQDANFLEILQANGWREFRRQRWRSWQLSSSPT